MRKPPLILFAAWFAAACADIPDHSVASDSGPSAARGAVIAQARCGGCHATGRFDDSPMRRAPPFRGLAERYPPMALQEALAEGVVTAHPAMPEFMFEPDEIGDLIAYLDAL